jgi:DnaJ-domain-containing protein 1
LANPNLAVSLALELADNPSLARGMRRRPLPRDVLMLIKIAAECPETSHRISLSTRMPPQRIREAAILYLETVVLSSGASKYRLLGVTPDAPQALLREHMRWIMKWLHPDRTKSDWESTFVHQVLGAWQELKSPERRAQYDLKLAQSATQDRTPRSAKVRKRSAGSWRERPLQPRATRPWLSGANLRRIRIAGLVLGAIAAVSLALWLLPSLVTEDADVAVLQNTRSGPPASSTTGPDSPLKLGSGEMSIDLLFMRASVMRRTGSLPSFPSVGEP